MHQLLPRNVLLITVPLEFYTLHILGDCVQALSAIYANMTINQYSNVQKYKYLFESQLVRTRIKGGSMRTFHKCFLTTYKILDLLNLSTMIGIDKKEF